MSEQLTTERRAAIEARLADWQHAVETAETGEPELVGICVALAIR